MKQLLIVILAICVILLMGCQSESYQTELTETDPSVMDATWQDINNTLLLVQLGNKVRCVLGLNIQSYLCKEQVGADAAG